MDRAAYTSVSFLKTFSRKLSDNNRYLIIGFIAFSTLIFFAIGKPVLILILAGTFNGFILPLGLALVLLAARKKEIIGDYNHPAWLTAIGWLVVLVMLGFTVSTLLF